MSDQSLAGCRQGRTTGTLGVLVALSVGVVTWCGCGDDEPPPSERGGSDPAVGTVDDSGKGREPAPAENSATWKTEQFQAAAGDQLQMLVVDLQRDGRFDPEVLARVAATEFTGDRLCPERMPVVHESGGLVIRRQATAVSDGSPGQHGAADGLVEALEELVSGWAGQSDIHLHFKITSIELGDDLARTGVLMEAGARQGDRFTQLKSRWLCDWKLDGKRPPRLLSLRSELLEQVTGSSPGGRLFVDATAGVLKPVAEVADQLGRSVDHWRGRLQAELGVALHGHQGLAVGDVDGDGLDDIYLCQPGGMPNRLLVQQPDGTVRDRARQAGVDWLDRSRSALLVDFDNDGDQDLACVLNINLVLMENDGRGRFTEREMAFATGDPYALAAADFDADGDLDLFVSGYGNGFLANPAGEGVLGESIPYPYHDANNGGPNLLLRNDGDWRFADATDEVGLGMNNRRWSFAASWSDYDGDGDPDLYVANDYGRNCLYRNDGGRFTDVAATAGVEDIAAGMSVSWCDYNGDGRPDLYVGNMFSSAGERIAYQRRFQPEADQAVRRQFQRHARGNTLFENVGDGTFRDVSVERDVTMGRWAWGSPFADINNDGRPDLLVANGYITGEDTNDL